MKVPLLSSLRHVRRGPSLVAGIALAAAGFVNAAPTVTSNAAATCPTGANLTVTPTAVQAIDPQGVIDSVIVPASANPRHYDEIVSASFYRDQSITWTDTLGTHTKTELKVCIQTNAPQPAWPATPSGDVGNQFEACGQPTQAAGYVGQDIVTIGHSPTSGAPFFDGPYNPEEGWAWCTAATFGVGEAGAGPVDTFSFFQDPSNNSGFYDLVNDGLIEPPASWVGNTVTLYIPNTLEYTIPANAAGTRPAFPAAEKIFDSTATKESTNLTVESFASTAVSLPSPVCLPIFDCLQTLFTLGFLTHWAPGGELGIPAFHNAGVDLGLLPGLPPGLNALPTCADIDLPLSDDPGPAPLHEVPVGYPPASDYPAGSTVLTPLVGTPLGANCGLIVGTSPGTPAPTQIEYDSENGRITGHDLPAVPAGTLPGQTAPDHLTNVFDFTGNFV